MLRVRFLLALTLATAGFLTATTASYAKGQPRPKPIPHRPPPVHVKPHPAHKPNPVPQHRNAAPKKPIPKAQKKQQVKVPERRKDTVHREAKKTPPKKDVREPSRVRPHAAAPLGKQARTQLGISSLEDLRILQFQRECGRIPVQFSIVEEFLSSFEFRWWRRG